MREPQKIYSDDKREATWQPGRVIIHSHVAKKDLPTIPMSALILDAKIQKDTVAMIRKSGQNPADLRVLARFGKSDLVAPTVVAEAIYTAATRLENEYRAECDRIANLPANRERNAIEALYEEAYRIERGTTDDNVMIPAQLRAEARERMVAWREKYSEAAKAEDRSNALTKAADLRSKAVGALTYDADGWISREEQKKRHDEFIREAEEIERGVSR